MQEALPGFASGSVKCVVVGVALGRRRMAADVVSIYTKMVNSIRRVALAPIFTMIPGLGLASKVALSFVMVFVVFSSAFHGVREADRFLIANTQIAGASPWQLTRSIIVPLAMSWIFALSQLPYQSCRVWSAVFFSADSDHAAPVTIVVTALQSCAVLGLGSQICSKLLPKHFRSFLPGEIDADCTQVGSGQTGVAARVDA